MKLEQLSGMLFYAPSTLARERGFRFQFASSTIQACCVSSCVWTGGCRNH